MSRRPEERTRSCRRSELRFAEGSSRATARDVQQLNSNFPTQNRARLDRGDTAPRAGGIAGLPRASSPPVGLSCSALPSAPRPPPSRPRPRPSVPPTDPPPLRRSLARRSRSQAPRPPPRCRRHSRAAIHRRRAVSRVILHHLQRYRPPSRRRRVTWERMRAPTAEPGRRSPAERLEPEGRGAPDPPRATAAPCRAWRRPPVAGCWRGQVRLPRPRRLRQRRETLRPPNACPDDPTRNRSTETKRRQNTRSANASKKERPQS